MIGLFGRRFLHNGRLLRKRIQDSQLDKVRIGSVVPRAMGFAVDKVNDGIGFGIGSQKAVA